MDPQPAIPLDDLPRPGVAISRARWLQLIAIEQAAKRVLLDVDEDGVAERGDVAVEELRKLVS